MGTTALHHIGMPGSVEVAQACAGSEPKANRSLPRAVKFEIRNPKFEIAK